MRGALVFKGTRIPVDLVADMLAQGATAKEILALGRLTPDDACGAVPVNGLLLAAKRRGLRADLIDLRNSGDTAGDKKRVVGYGAFAFYER